MSFPDLRGHALVLASASARRAELLRLVGLAFEVLPAAIDETPRPGEMPSVYVARLAREKAEVVAPIRREAVGIAADTTVDVDGQILEKPEDDADAHRMLRLLSGRTHRVHSGVAVWGPALAGGNDVRVVTTVVETSVRFVELTDSMIEWYVATGEADGKAGGYGIQGAAGAFVDRIDGSVTNVIGLPLAETLAMVTELV